MPDSVKTSGANPTSGAKIQDNATKFVNFIKPPEGIGASSPDSTISMPKKAAGSILTSLSTLFAGGGKLLNKGLMNLAEVLIILPTVIVGASFGVVGMMIGLVSGAVADKGDWKLGGVGGLVFGATLTAVVINAPFFIAKVVAGGTLTSIGLGFAILGGSKKVQIEKWEENFIETSFKIEKYCIDFIDGVLAQMERDSKDRQYFFRPLKKKNDYTPLR